MPATDQRLIMIDGAALANSPNEITVFLFKAHFQFES
jgi:hypothetical protein